MFKSNQTPEEKAQAKAAKEAKREQKARELDAKIADLDRKMKASKQKQKPASHVTAKAAVGIPTVTTSKGNGSEWTVREGGRNGVVTVSGPTITRTFKKVMGRDDTTSIPIRMVASVHVDRRGLGTDIITVSTTGGDKYVWKTPGAQEIAEAINTYTP